MTISSEFSNAADTAVLTNEEVQAMVNPPLRSGGINAIELSFKQWLAAVDDAEQEAIRTYREYYEASYERTLTDRLKAFLEIDNGVDFRLNYLPIAVDVLNERMNVTGFKAEEGQGGEFTDDEPGIFPQWWIDNRMDVVQKDVHHSSFVDGKSYVLTEWDNENGRPKMSHEEAYDGTYGMIVRYDESDGRTIRFAVKRWRIESGPSAGTTARMNVYTPNAIYKFITGKSGWVEFVDDPGGAWPLPWVDSSGNPLGVTIAQFDNRKSEIHDLMGAQNALNKVVLDEIAGADVEGFRMPTLTGGKKAPETITVGPGKIMWAGEGWQWGNIPAGDIAALTAAVNAYIMRIPQISRIPMSYFQVTGAISSGESQKASDTPLISKAEDRTVRFGNAWEDVMAHSRTLHNAFGTGEMEIVPISTEWASVERVDAAETARKETETNKLKSETFVILVNQGVDRHQAAVLAGYTEEEAELMAASGGRVLPQDTDVNDVVDTLDTVTDGDNPENIESDKGLNGAQINAAKDLLTGVSDGTVAPGVATELLISLGIDRERVERMVAEAAAFNLAEVDND